MSDREGEDGLFAAVDLGSRSFHLKVARVHGENIEVVDRLKEPVWLAAGIRNRRVDPAAWARAAASLARIGERLRDIPPERSRAVGTNAFRQLRDPKLVLGMASEALGRPVEVIAGAEEARLIYLGVAHTLPPEPARRLVIDIGGGSTELVVGRGLTPVRTESLFMGCVSFTRRFFPGGAITRKAFAAAEMEAKRELASVEDPLLRLGWSEACGSSGTVKAAARLLHREGGLTRRGLKRLKRRMVHAGHSGALSEGPDAIAGLRPERARDFPGGAAILRAVMKTLGLRRLEVSEGALREGLLHDLIGRQRKADVRETTVRNLMAQYRVDRDQARRVWRTARVGFRQLRTAWTFDGNRPERFLRWAAWLHEIGLAVSFSGHHRHGAYIVRNSDMPGFSRNDQELLSALIETHRRRLRPERFEELNGDDPEQAVRLAAILRVAVLLCRRRSRIPLPRIAAAAEGPRLVLRFPRSWLASHPLTASGLEEERTQLRAAGLDLWLERSGAPTPGR